MQTHLHNRHKPLKSVCVLGVHTPTVIPTQSRLADSKSWQQQGYNRLFAYAWQSLLTPARHHATSPAIGGSKALHATSPSHHGHPLASLFICRWGTTVRVWDLPSRQVVAKWDLASLPGIREFPRGLMSVRWTGAWGAGAYS